MDESLLAAWIIRKESNMQTEREILTQDQVQRFLGEPNINGTERTLSMLGAPVAAYLGIKRGGLIGAALGLAAAELAIRGLTGRSPLYRALGRDTSFDVEDLMTEGVWVGKIITVARPVEELYSFWRNFSNLPRFMTHLDSVTEIGDRRSHWVVEGPLGIRLSWDSEIIDEEPNKLIVWRSVPGTGIATAGHVRFHTLTENKGTEISVVLGYVPPAGPLGEKLAELLSMGADAIVEENLACFKQLMETGEAPKKSGQRQKQTELPADEPQRRDIERRSDTVQMTSEDSFPASDPPASW